MLWLAALSVAMYLAELKGLWRGLGFEAGYGRAMVCIDLVFLADLLAKVRWLGLPYLASAWFFIDLVSTLPVLSSLGGVHESFVGLRVLREIRFIRTMRALRMLRVVRTLRVLESVVRETEDTDEARAFGRALYASTAVYTGAFLWVMGWVQARWPAGSADGPAVEFAVVLASVLGMTLVLVVSRFQIPDLASRQIKVLLNLALPRQVAEQFIAHPETYDRAVRMPATIVFIDIRGFTPTVERLGSDLGAVKDQLERLLDAVVDVHNRYDLIVDKFVGDCVMSFRGGDLVAGDPAEHAWRVVAASMESLRAAEQLRNCPFSRLKAGGASSEDCLIGTFGTSKRLSYTVLGDAVNLAARLESACGQTGCRSLFCERTYLLTRERPGILWRRVGELRVPGRDKTVKVHEALGLEAAGDGRWLEAFGKGLAAYEGRLLQAAREAFSEADRLRPGGDTLSLFYVKLCDRFLKVGLPDGWKPLIEMRK